MLWSLFVTHTTFNVPSLMGTIMSIGVATANSILLVTFANEMREVNHKPQTANSENGHVDNNHADNKKDESNVSDGSDNEMEEVTTAALAAGYTRFRPVIMTALAMILGMLPMSLGLGEGGEQNAPLGRAVIGGLIVATFTTLFFVPIMYTVMRRKYVPPIKDSNADE